MSLDSEIALLKQFPIFAALDAQQLQLLAFNGERRRYRAGDVLFHEGSVGSGAVIVISGEIALERKYDDGMVEEDTLGAGMMVGELSMITSIERASSARALTDVDVFMVSRRLFRRVLDEFPDTAGRVRDLVSDRLRRAVGDLSSVQPRFQGDGKGSSFPGR